MIPHRKMDELLDDVLLDEKAVTLKESLLLECRLELARKRQRSYKWWIVPAAAALLLILLRLFMATEIEGPGPGLSGLGSKPYYVTTHPLSADRLVHTYSPSEAREHRVHTRTTADLVVFTRLSDISVSTMDRPPVESITDEEMLAMFPGVPVSLVDKGGNNKTLIFLNPEDKSRFMEDIGG